MLFHVLGPLELNGSDGQPSGVTAEKQQRLLLALLLGGNSWIPADTLVDAVWPAGPPASAASNLQTYIHQLRQLIPPHPDGEARIASRPGHHRLAVRRDECDATMFEDLVDRAVATPATAVTHYREALALWRGRPYDALDNDAVRAESARLRELRWAARDGLADALLATGAAADVITLLAPLAAADPLREATWQRLLTAYRLAGRRSDGLVAYQRARRHLTEHGVEPGAELQRLRQLLLDDTGIPAASASASASAEQDSGTEDRGQGDTLQMTRDDPDEDQETASLVAPEPPHPKVVGAAVARTIGTAAASGPRPAAASRPGGPRPGGPPRNTGPRPRTGRVAERRWWYWFRRHPTFSIVAASMLAMTVVAASTSAAPLGIASSPRAAPSGAQRDAPSGTPSGAPSHANPGRSVAGPPAAPAPDRPAKAAPPRAKRAAPPAPPAAQAGPPQLRFLSPARGAVVSGRIVIRVQVTNPARLKQVDFHYLTLRCSDDGGDKDFIGADKTPGPGGVYEISFDTRRADDGCLHFGAVGLDRYDDTLYPSEGTYVKVSVNN